jgi:hypothetical protein
MKRALMGLVAFAVLAWSGATASAEDRSAESSRLNVAPAIYQDSGQAPVEEVQWRRGWYGYYGRPYSRYYSYRPYYGYNYGYYPRYGYSYSYPRYSYRYHYDYGYPRYSYRYRYWY